MIAALKQKGRRPRKRRQPSQCRAGRFVDLRLISACTADNGAWLERGGGGGGGDEGLMWQGRPPPSKQCCLAKRSTTLRRNMRFTTCLCGAYCQSLLWRYARVLKATDSCVDGCHNRSCPRVGDGCHRRKVCRPASLSSTQLWFQGRASSMDLGEQRMDLQPSRDFIEHQKLVEMLGGSIWETPC